MAEVIERGRTEQVGAAAADLLAQATDATASCKPATATLLLPDPEQQALWAAERLDDQQIATLRDTANLPLPVRTICPDGRFAEAMRSLTILPRKADDKVTGDLRLRLYRWQLREFSEGDINFLVKEALANCKFFPTPAECLAILGRRDGPVERAKRLQGAAQGRIRREMQQRYLDWLTQLRRGDLTQAEVDAAPPRWCAVGETQGLLRKTETGAFVLRGKAREAA